MQFGGVNLVSVGSGARQLATFRRLNSPSVNLVIGSTPGCTIWNTERSQDQRIRGVCRTELREGNILLPSLATTRKLWAVAEGRRVYQTGSG